MVSEIKHFADWNNTQGLYEAIKALNGLRKQTIFPCPTDKKPLHKDEYETKQLADHFEITLFLSLINYQIIIQSVTLIHHLCSVKPNWPFSRGYQTGVGKASDTTYIWKTIVPHDWKYANIVVIVKQREIP